ncbi:MAG: DNA primase small subunit domain-containing protein [Candidatus Hermodarchaeota archaeon]
MSEKFYLKRLFQRYYEESCSKMPTVSFFNKREYGFIPWEEQVMERHLSFENSKSINNFFKLKAPKHAYLSGSLYSQPEIPDMEGKGYQGCDLIIDIDVDHFYTLCKEEHDFWHCKECDERGRGMPDKCPKCENLKLVRLSWICEDCLNVAKKEMIKLIYDFLIPDFAINPKDIKIAFSGHRGYHLKIENEKIRTLSSEERREITDYVTGQNISFEILGLREHNNIVYGFFKDNIGWPAKIMKFMVELLKKPNSEIYKLLVDNRKFGFNSPTINSLLNYKDDFLEMISNNKRNMWALEGFTPNTWKKLLKCVVKEIGAEIDIPVTIDIHRLIRYPGSLHGKTGFKVQEIFLDEFDDFNPLNESKEHLDPIVFLGKKETHKLEIIENNVPVTKIKGKKYGPYVKGDIIEVPHHIAVFLLCREVAKSI